MRGNWNKLGAVGMIESEQEIKGPGERRSALLYRQRRRQDRRAVRPRRASPWGVEAMHWVLDVTFREDDCRVRKGHAARNLSAIRKFSLSALRADTLYPTRSLRRRRKLADHRPEYRSTLLRIKAP